MVFKTFRLQLRFLIPLVITLVVAANLALPWMDGLMLRWASRDQVARGALVANAVSESVARALNQGRVEELEALFNRTLTDERLLAMALCRVGGDIVMQTALFPQDLTCERARQTSQLDNGLMPLASGRVQVGVHPVSDGERPVADLVLVSDLSILDRRSEDTRRHLLTLIAVLGGVVSLITVVVAQLSWRGWVAGVQGILRGEGLVRPLLQPAPELQPFAEALRERMRELDDEYRRAQAAEQPWDPERLRTLLKTQLRGDQVIVVSNREPYIHEHSDGQVVVKRPASGLVTAVEPVMRACSGTWIAHGSGSADALAVDANDRVMVPPGRYDYALRRVWLTPEEEQGYYYGFANEGLWPLCHVAHVRPVFRESDWQMYRRVNERFAEAVVKEARSADPVVLVQDYHFALLPAMIRERLPQATIITFWHIPWPNPESFGICPWRRELLQGMLGSTILGFHTRFHCKNFLETVDRYLECRIEHEHNMVSYGSHNTLVENYPISIKWPDAQDMQRLLGVQACAQNVRAAFGLKSGHKLILGVDRFDYTKGILERLHALERLLEKHPSWQGKVSLLQVAAPTRGQLDEYQEFQQRIFKVTQRINQRYGLGEYRPVILVAEHQDADKLAELYRAADVCLVTSLHDGMNLVCKEFVAMRDDDQGVLVLSRFAGAARELPEALIINPYHVEESADALHRALTMPQAEQKERMRSMRMTVREHNVFRWAGRMLSDTARVRLRSRIEARLQAHQLT
ncbi:MAG: trehalose-6-phosphate synthase [Aquabacterium sp.]